MYVVLTGRWLAILSQNDFCIEYGLGKQKGHCDPLSRGKNQMDCVCPEQDRSEPLKYGPCKKCLKRAHDMMHGSLYQEAPLTQEEKAADLKKVSQKRLSV